jgi:3-phenylpropionate/cinnamic acid dioxygenase small subunit
VDDRAALALLADREAVRDLLCAYARAVDGKDLAAVAACFTADCAYEGTLGRGTIADALASLERAFARYDRTMHCLSTQQVEVDGDAARAETYCVAYHVRPDGAHLTTGVRYLDELVRTHTGWRIRRRRVRIEWTREDEPAGSA